MLLTAVEEQRPKDEKGNMAKQDGIEFDEVKALRLDYKSKCNQTTISYVLFLNGSHIFLYHRQIKLHLF